MPGWALLPSEFREDFWSNRALWILELLRRDWGAVFDTLLMDDTAEAQLVE